jgi:imidazolonepropionase-like amidohydrolase
MRGFTAIRDMGGPVFGLKRAIDEGLLPGPRIYPSGAVITITGGHGDFRSLLDLPRRAGTLSRVEETGAAIIADSPDEVRMRTREQLMQGALQIKLTAGGGVASPFSPLDIVTFTEPELRAAVEAAEDWGHLCLHPRLHAGLYPAFDCRGSEMHQHAHLMDDETAKLMAEKGIWLSTQPLLDMGGEGGAQELGPAEQAKMKQVIEGTDNVYRLAKKYHLKTAFGTDILFSAHEAEQQGNRLAALVRWYTPARSTDHGDINKRRIACPVRSSQSIPRQARRS